MRAVDRVCRRVAALPGVVAVGHYGWPLPLVIGIGLHRPGLGLDLPVRVAALAPLVAVGAAVAAHGATLWECGRCRPRLSPPADVPVQVARRMWLLRLLHHPWRSGPFWALVAATAVLVVTGQDGWSWWLSGVPMTALVVSGLVWGPRVHARLQQGCPWCGHEGHGPEDGGRPRPLPPGPDGRRPCPAAVGQDEVRAVASTPAVPDTADELIARWATQPQVGDPVVVTLPHQRGDQRGGGRS